MPKDFSSVANAKYKKQIFFYKTKTTFFHLFLFGLTPFLELLSTFDLLKKVPSQKPNNKTKPKKEDINFYK